MSSSLRLREKIGQLLMVGFRGAEPGECRLIERDLRDHAVGGIVLFDQEMVDATARRRNVVSPDQVKRLVAHLQACARQPGTLLVSIDQEGGRVNRLKADYGFPPSVSQDELGQLDQLEETTRQARITARTLASVGINFNLAPVVDLDANPNNPIIKGKRRCFSSDPDRTARHASAVVQAHRDEGVLTCLKHFPGHGSAAGDTHLGLVDVTQTWSEKELIPFQRLITADLCDAVMSCHVFNARLDPDRPATLSRAVITGLLRQKLGFQGVVTSDDMEMRAISSQYGLEESVPSAIEAGIDVLCFGNNQSYEPDIAPKAIDILVRAVSSGRIPEARIDESVHRIQALKRRIGVKS
ncbi:MAG TPA: glycoside hydrolase family 3 protein [Opitutaceae bacterium]|nr:glycoside hydrolase family 3 protein [Opitutaceae bacterium]